MIKRVRIAIDHGNRNIKTVHTVFTTGISESDIRPGRGVDYLEYNGKFYVPSNRRIPYQRDKTQDQRFFALTLLGIAKELEQNSNIEKGDLLQVQLPIGLPPKHFAELYDKYEKFFKGKGDMIRFTYRQNEYHINIIDVMAFPQDYAAIMLQYKEICEYPKVVGVDIGGFTTDYLMFRSGIEDMEICDSMETGIISLYNRIIARIRADYDVLLEEIDVDSIIKGKKGLYETKVVNAVLQEAEAYVTDLLASLRERGIDLKSTLFIFLGGGSILLKELIESSGVISHVQFIEDIHANAKGYDYLYQQQGV